MKQIRIKIPEPLHKQARLAAIRAGVTLAEFVERALEMAVLNARKED